VKKNTETYPNRGLYPGLAAATLEYRVFE